MKILDTLAIIGALNVEDKTHRQAFAHLSRLSTDRYLFITTISLLEFESALPRL